MSIQPPDDRLFDAIIDDLRDCGVVAVEELMRQTQKRLEQKYIVEAKEYNEEDLYSEVAELNAEWPHDGDRAVVSGRLYAVDSSYEYHELEPVQEMLHDDARGQYIIADSLALRSEGVMIAPVLDVSAKVAYIRIGYYFSHLEDDSRTPLYFAELGELEEHSYRDPSPQEVIKRLQRDWQTEMAYLEGIVRDEHHSELDKLKEIAGWLAEQKSIPGDLHTLIELYLRQQLVFDMDISQDMTVVGSLKVLNINEDDLDEDDENDERYAPGHILTTKTGLTMAVSNFSLYIVESITSEPLQIHLYFDVFNLEEDEPERVCVEVTDITRLVSRRLSKSLANIAFEGGSYLDELAENAKKDTQKAVQDEATDVVLAGYEETVDSSYTAYPEHIRNILDLKDAIEAIKDEARRQSDIWYDTYEEAAAASRAVYVFMAKALARVENSGTYKLAASGGGVFVANIEQSYTFDDKNPTRLQTVSHVPNDGPHMRPIDDGDTVEGYIGAHGVHIHPYEGDDDSDETEEPGDITAFGISLNLVLAVSSVDHVTAHVGAVELSTITEKRTCLVNVTDALELRSLDLDDYTAAREAIDRLSVDYADEPVVPLLVDMCKEFYEFVSPVEYFSFDHPTSFHAIDAFLKRESTSPQGRALCLQALESLLVDRNIKCKAAIAHQEVSTERKEIVGMVVDIRTDVEGSDVFLSVRVNSREPALQVRLASMSDLRF